MDILSHLPPPPPIAGDWALFLDVDGTLLDFPPSPNAVEVPTGLVGALQTLHRELGGALALISGRPLAQLDRLFSPLRLPAAGLHGLERRLDQSSATTPAAAQPIPMQTFLRNARSLVSAYPGALLEDKGATVALHWRGNPDAGPVLLALAEAALAWLPGYHLQPGDQVLELRPDGADKGAAIEALLASEPFRGRRPVFVGDDLTDEHGFAMVLKHAGMAVLVGEPRPSAAGHSLADPAAVRAWLGRGVGHHATGHPGASNHGAGHGGAQSAP